MGKSLTPWEALGNAVVLRAAKDYRSALRRLKRFPENKAAQKAAKECEEFFLGPVIEIYTSLDGKMIMDKIREEEGL